MSVGILFLAALLAQDRLSEAVRKTDLEGTRKEIARPPTAQAIIAALPRARDRIAALHAATLKARNACDNVETAFPFGEEDSKIQRRAKEAAEDRVKEAFRRANEGEQIHEALVAALAKLPLSAAETVARYAQETGSWLLKCELYEGLGRMGGQEALLAALDREKEPVVVATILNGLAGDRASAYLDHPQWQVRLSAVRALRWSPESVERLISLLPDPDARFRNGALESLHALTGTPLPAEPGAWQDWWKVNGEEFRAGRYRPEQRKEPPGPGRTTFYDVPLRSTRLCFVIDRSLSMREEGRFEAAKAELRRLIEELPDGARFNIVFFGASTTCFAGSPRALDRAVRREAAYFVDRLGFASGTNLYLALEKALTFVGSADSGALREDGVDTLIVLSDGRPTVGRLIDDELVARVTARRARYLRPVIHAVTLGSEARSLKLLAELTGGEFRSR